VPIPEPLRWLEASETRDPQHARAAGIRVMRVSLYEDVARSRRIAKTYDYPVLVNSHYIMSPARFPKFDNPKLDRNPRCSSSAPGANAASTRCRRIRRVKSLDFDDHPFHVESWDRPCALCGATDSFLDEIITDDAGTRMLVCSDTDHCTRRQDETEGGTAAMAWRAAS
jgi:alpha-D-ribose 1-methylphosphonate 5-phosphate C-P lyase